MTISEAIDAERNRQSISVNELARRANQSPGRVHSILSGETANPSFGTVQALLSGLNKSLSWLDRELRKVKPMPSSAE